MMRRGLLNLGAIALKATAEKTAPLEFLVVPMGSYETSKGTFELTTEAAAGIVAASVERGVPTRIDYEHASMDLENAKDPAEAGKAAGFFSLEARDDGLWAVDVKWTTLGEQKVADGEMPFISPVIFIDVETMAITGLESVAITANPATIGAEPLVELSAKDSRTVALGRSFSDIHGSLIIALREALRGTDDWSYIYIVDVFDDRAVYEWNDKVYEVTYRIEGSTAILTSDSTEVQRTYEPVEGGVVMKTILKALGLSENATEAEALVALNAIKSERDDAGKPVAELLTLTGKSTASEALGFVMATKDDAAKVVELTANLAERTAADAKTKAEALVDQAILDGKVAPAQKELMLSMGEKDPAMLASYIDTAVALPGQTGAVTPPAEGAAPAKTEEEKKVEAQFNLSEDGAPAKLSGVKIVALPPLR